MTAPAPTARPKLRSPARLRYDEARQTELLLLPERVVRLNPTAGAILRLCDGTRTVAGIVERLETEYNQKGLEPDIVDFLAEAADKGWVESWERSCPTP